MGILTNAGRDLFAQKAANSEVLVIDRFLLANIAGLDPSAAENPNEVLPAVGDRVAELAVTQQGYVSADQVVYSLYLATGDGDYTFNWVGLLADDNTLVAVSYIEPITKYATNGANVGNSLTRNFLITYTDAQAITSITVEASTWQLNFDRATETTAGLVKIATQPITDAGTDDQDVITPKKLADTVVNSLTSDAAKRPLSAAKGKELKALIDAIDQATTDEAGIVELATATEMSTGTDTLRVPAVKTVADYVATKVAELVDSSPAALDTLNELAAALGDDPNFATTVSAELGTKASTAYVNQRLPSGLIAMWSGTVATIPTGWALCDGTNGTPDLRDRFIVGAGSSYSPGNTGGNTSSATSSSGDHSHTESSAGSHSHGGATAGHALTIAEMPAHTHGFVVDLNYNNAGSRAASANDDGPVQNSTTDSTGGGQQHTHGINSDGGHTHTINNAGGHTHTVNIMPRYYALAYIMLL